MDEQRLAEIERAMGEYVKVKELVREIRRCWAWIDRYRALFPWSVEQVEEVKDAKP